ncbi:hypothetical protein AALO_G00236710 [Alosa alosa]|uniref:Muscular LMNA-interacting protein n=1 Tax=Alosa alosa TaxID=278164 RepID=A0AAV6G2K7_9TELE|nr:muscular LMNA-interacting protein isoform X2 [Alosa alosa]KAG5266831.1 hypothetical protein AALO_G00236710 [Alosa alosa]
MDLEHINGSLNKASPVGQANLTPFTFVPILAKLPTKSRIILVGRKLLSAFHQNQSLEEPIKDTSYENTMDGGVYKAEFVYIGDSEENEPADSPRETTQAKKLKASSADLIAQTPPLPSPSPSPSPSTPVPALGQISICNSSDSSPASLRAAMETDPNKHEGFSFRPGRHSTSPGTSGRLYFNHEPESDRDEFLSPATSVDLLPSLVSSSRESILSEGWDRDRSCLASPALSSLSRAWSPCSSVRSGAFSPAVVRLTRHSLAPGASLVRMTPGGSASCSSSRAASRGPSPCPSVSPHVRHRPPPTQLSLLTAILRKGRLPVLSAATERPYSPCWPISPVHMSSCPACRAAARVGPVVGGGVGPQDSEAHTPKQHSLCHRETSDPKSLNSVGEPQFISPSDGVFGSQKSIFRSEPLKSYVSSWGAEASRLSSPATRTNMSDKSASNTPRRVLKPVNAEIHVSPAPSPQLYTSFSRLSNSPKPSYASCCASEGPGVTSPPCHRGTACSAQSENSRPASGSENDGNATRLSSDKLSPAAIHAHRLSPLPRIPQLSSPRRTPTPTLTPTPTSTSLSHAPYRSAATPDRFTLSPSPLTLSRDLSPSPSFPPSSTPSPTPKGRVSVSADREDKKSQPCKIKSSYKALAAIPTNTLLLEQQAIDNEVEKKENSLDPSETFSMEEARAEMCSPAQLRAQSEELYAVIDEVLEESPIPFRRPLLSPSPTTRWEETDSVKRYTPRSSPRTVGRETKYANYHLQSPGLGEQHVTKPGVIRPTSVTSRLPTDNEEEEYIPNPFKTYQDGHLKNNPNKYACLLQGEPEADGGRPSSSQSSAKKSISSGGMTFGLLPPSLWLATTGDSQTGPSALTTTLAKMEVHETDI